MRKIGLVFTLLFFSALSVGGCGDKEKSQAQQSWNAFKTQEIQAIKNAHADREEKPTDFASRFTEVEDPYAYRFKGFIQFKKGNAFQELAYALVDGEWTPVSYDDQADIEAKKAKEKRIGDLEKKILALKGQIASNEQTLKRYQELMAETKAKKKELAALEAELEEILGQKQI
jgi:hypothetical protein